jgi:acyl-CoA reductase-like NAD-dependent aldehyde dehydrogenase
VWGEIMTGDAGVDRAGYFVQTTVLAKVRPAIRIMREKIVGPVLRVIQYEDEEELFNIAIDSSYGPWSMRQVFFSGD